MSNFDILQGDVMDQLRTLSAASVHCCVTSPPYFGLRSYGVDGQIGLEKTSAEYIAKLVAVFGDVRRVLRGDGQLWLNLGDSYSGAHYSNQANTGGAKREQGGKQSHTPTSTIGMKPKDLMMIPARVAIALQDDGWWLRSVIIWNKLNPMPESVTDRPTTAHEYIFLLTKAERYFYDAAAVAEPVAASTVGRGPVSFGGAKGRAYEPEPTDPNYRGGNEQWGRTYEYKGGTRNQRSVWTMATEPFPESHFAVFPTEIPRRAILAGTSEHGCCAECGAPWRRVVERNSVGVRNTNFGGYGQQVHREGASHDLYAIPSSTVGWAATCPHNAPVVPCTVLDPFAGAFTTVLVANRLGRRGIGIDLSEKYCQMGRDRIINDAPLFNMEIA